MESGVYTEKRREYMRLWRLKNRKKINTQIKNWNNNNPEKAKAIKDRWRSKNLAARRKHNRTYSGCINATGESKTDNCEICGTFTKLVYDHNHSTGEFRGWLCMTCYTRLGHHESWYLVNKEIIDKYLEVTHVNG